MDTNKTASGPLDGFVVDHHRQTGPTALRMLVGTQLRRLREARGITREDAGHAIRASHSKISRLELGRTGFKLRDVADLLALYGVTDDAERASVLALAKQANAPGWWHDYGDVLPGWFEPYLGLEQAASVIRTYAVQFIPGLLQIEDYARAVFRLGHPDAPPVEIERRVRLRMERGKLLRRMDPPNLWALIDEAVLRRPIGGVATMRRQIEHLIGIAELSNVTVQLLPFSAGGQAEAGWPITMLRFPEGELPDVAYLEYPTGALYLDKPADTSTYRHIMNCLGLQAEQPVATMTALHRIRDETNS